MSNATATLKMLLLGEDKSASAALKHFGHQAGLTGDDTDRMSKRAKVAILGLAGAATAFGVSSVNKFKQVGFETLSLQRTLGGTTEDASRLRFAAEETGVSFESLSKSTGILSKNLVTASGSTKGNAAMIRALGFDYRDAHGHILPMSQLLPEIAERFKRMPAGAERTALALKLFGRSGKDMLPFLLRGKDGIAALEHESDKLGLTLGGKNIDALRKARASQREWNASLDGLRVQIGAQLLPIMNSLVGFIREHVIPVIAAVTGFIREHKTAVGIAVAVIGTLVVGLKAWAIAQGILNAAMEANPIVLIITALVALGVGLVMAYRHSEKFRAIVQATFHAVAEAGRWMWQNVLKPVIDALTVAWKWLYNNVIQPNAQAMAAAFHTVGAGLRWAWDNVIHPVITSLTDAWKFLHRNVIKPVSKAISDTWKVIGTGLQWAWDHIIHPILGFILDQINAVKDALSTITGLFNNDTSNVTDLINRAKAAGVTGPNRGSGGPRGPHGRTGVAPQSSTEIHLHFTGQAMVTQADVGRAVKVAIQHAQNAGVAFPFAAG